MVELPPFRTWRLPKRSGGSRGLQAPECSRSIEGLQARHHFPAKCMGIGSSGPPTAELKGYISGVRASPRRTGLSSIYDAHRTNFSCVMICVSLKLRIHTSSLLFNRKEKLPLINCMAFSSETSGAGVIRT